MALNRQEAVEEAVEDDEVSSEVTLDQFNSSFPVVLLDSSQLFNAAHNMDGQTLALVRREAAHALKVLESRAEDAFGLLFTEGKDLYRKFDYVFRYGLESIHFKICSE